MIFSAILTLTLFNSLAAHTWLTSPSSAVRPIADGSGVCRGGDAKKFNDPCCAPKSSGKPAATVYQRGQTVTVTWPRNNHPGGIVEFSVVPFAQSTDSVDLYAANVFQVNCNEQTCRSGSNDLLGPDSQTPASTNTCLQTITIPPFLSDGQYTIMWRVYGFGGFYQDVTKQQGDYLQCFDFTVSGGSAATTKPASLCPLPKLGDTHTSDSNKCFFYGKGQLDECPNDGCSASTQTATPPRFAQCWANGGQNIYSNGTVPTGPPPSPSPTGPAVPPPQPSPSTSTGVVSSSAAPPPASSSAPGSSSSSAPGPVTSGSVAPTGTASSVSSGSTTPTSTSTVTITATGSPSGTGTVPSGTGSPSPSSTNIISGSQQVVLDSQGMLTLFAVLSTVVGYAML